MFAIFSYSLNALLPLFIIIFFGYFIARNDSVDKDFFRKLNQLCFRYFLPIQLFQNVYQIESMNAINWTVILYMLLSIFVLAALGVLAARLFVSDSRQKGVLVQAVFRSNLAVIGPPLATALGGVASAAFNAVSTAFMVPILNILAVIIFTIYGSHNQKLAIGSLVKKIFCNPLIIGAFCGLVVVFLRQIINPIFSIQYDFAPIYQALQTVSQIASPIMLFCLGAGLDFKATSNLRHQIFLGLGLRLCFAPFLVIGSAVLLRNQLGLTMVELPALIALSASSVAVTSTVMAQESGCDDQYASQLVVWSSVCSLVTNFCIISLLKVFSF